MRVLVTGAGGFAGTNVVQHLITTTDWTIVTVDRTRAYYANPRVYDYAFDLRNPIPTNQFGEIDAVIHLAASSNVAEFLVDPAKHVVNNVVMTANLLQWTLHQNLKVFIQVSSNEVYGPTNTFAVSSSEWDAFIPATPYSASKAAQDMLAIGWHQAYGTPCVIAITSHLFGEGQPSSKFIPTIIRNVMSNESVPIYGRQFGDDWEASVRNWTYVGDFAHALKWIIEKGVVAGFIDRWNVAGPLRSCYQVAEDVAELLKLPLSVEWQSNREARPGYEHHYAVDTTAFEQHGYTPFYTYADGLKRTVNWYKERYKK